MGIAIYRTKVKPNKRGLSQVFTYYPKSLQPSEIIRYNKSERTKIADFPVYFLNCIKGILCKELLDHELDELNVAHASEVGHKNPLHHLLHFSSNEGFIGPKAVQEIYGFFMETSADDFTPQRIGYDEYEAIITLIHGIRDAARRNEYLEFVCA